MDSELDVNDQLDMSVHCQYNKFTMYEQKLYKNGNSVAVTIPKEYLKELGLRDGSEVVVEKDPISGTITIGKKGKTVDSSLTPEFYVWLKRFNARYKNALKELARK